ncbi:MAG: DUF3048 domain-containing protein [Clostridium sp.]|nr:DUF3048 domain-containing protein [Clostridium sp.]
MKNKSKLLLGIIILVSFMVVGCTKKPEPIVTPSKPEAVETKVPVPAPVEAPQKYYSPYTGEVVEKESLDNIAVLAIVENLVAARPQSGLNAADIVYETVAEGGIPRFIALF